LHFRQVTVAGSSSGDWVRTCGPGSPHAGHVPRYISSALTAASSWGKPKSTSHRGPDPQQRIRCEKLEGHGTTFTVRPRPHRAYPEAAVDRSPERRIGELSERLYFGSTTTGRSSAQSGAREGLSEMGRRQSAKNARRFSPRRRPAERTRRPSCRHARGRGEPLLRPGAAGAARPSRHAESLACAARAFHVSVQILFSNHGTYRSINVPWMPSRKRKSVSGKVNSRGHGRVQTWRQQRPRRAVASHSAIPSGTLPFSHCEFLTSAGRWRHMTATSTVQRPALLATPPSRSVPCLCPRTTRRMLRPPSPRRYPSTSPRVLLISRVRRSPAPAGGFAH